MPSPPKTIRVLAPSRLHFGLLSFGAPQRRQFGGCGVMVAQPNLRVIVSAADRFTVAGPYADRVRRIAAQWQVAFGHSELPSCRVELESAPPLHAGFGVGTQLSLSIATGLQSLVGVTAIPVTELAVQMGRGVRSAIGTHGFAHGGLIAELGKLPGKSVAPLYDRVELPVDWRFLLITGATDEGLSGRAEREAFEQLPAVPAAATERLERLMIDSILPAARAAQFDDFAVATQEFGFISGNCFAAVQGGAYNGPQLTTLVRQLQSLGAQGIGQSSWGPTIFAVCRDQTQAHDLARELISRNWAAAHTITITAPNNRGAELVIE